MPLLLDNYGAIDGRKILVLDTPEYPSVRFMAYLEGPGTSGPTSACGPTPKIAADRLLARTEDPAPRRPLIPDGRESLSTPERAPRATP